MEQLAEILHPDLPLYLVPAQLRADPADVHAHRMGEQLPAAGDVGVHLPLEQRPVQVAPLAPYLHVIEYISFLFVQLVPQYWTQPTALPLSTAVRVIAHLPFLGVPVENHVLPADAAAPLQAEFHFFFPNLLFMELLQLLHAPLVAVFLCRHMHLAPEADCLVLLEVLMLHPAAGFLIWAAHCGHVVFKGPSDAHIAQAAVALAPLAL